MVPKSDHLANTRFDKKPSAQADCELLMRALVKLEKHHSVELRTKIRFDPRFHGGHEGLP